MRSVSITEGFSIRKFFSGLAEILNNGEYIEVKDLSEEQAIECDVTEDVMKELKSSQNTRIALMEKTFETVPKEKKKKTARGTEIIGANIKVEPKTERPKTEVIVQEKEDDEKVL